MEHADIIRAVEATLFVHGEPMKPEAIAKVISGSQKGNNKGAIDSEQVREAIKALDERLTAHNSALTIVTIGDYVQIATRKEVSHIITELIKAEMNEALTPAALETLSIIAYSGPTTRARIDYIRGVNSSFILRALLIRGLIDRAPHKEHAHTYEYMPSMMLLKHLGVARREELPDYEAFQEVVRKMEQKEILKGNANEQV